MMVSTAVLLATACVAANLPFFTSRLFGLWLLPGSKSVFWHAVECVAYYCLVGGLARLLEARESDIHPQGWVFYVVTVAVFLVLAFPGVVWRYVRGVGLSR